MAATKAQISWSPVTYSSVAIVRVTSVSFGQGGTLLKFKGDVDLYPTVIACADIEPHAAVTTADVGPMMALSPGTDATLVATLKDAKAQTGGDVVFTMTHSVFENADASGAHAAYGTVTGTWQAYSTDGVTPPLVITRV